jgi:hypothetical protein
MLFRWIWVIGLPAILASAPWASATAQTPTETRPKSHATGLAGEKPKPSEFLQMLGAIILHGSDMGPNTGWFHPSRSRFDWKWLAERFDRDKNGALEPEELKGSGPLFRALDRDHDGTVTPEDLDWSPQSRYLQVRGQARGRFGRMDRNGNGRISREEWDKAFFQAAGEKGFLTPDDLADHFYMPPPRSPAGQDKRPSAPEGPSRWTLLKGLISGEIGSPFEGPRLAEEAPEFLLETHDKSRSIALSDFRGRKPIVLIFGSFT